MMSSARHWFSMLIVFSISIFSAEARARLRKSRLPPIEKVAVTQQYFGMMIFDGRIIEKAYPNEGLDAGLSGLIKIHETVDKGGNVIGCKADYGLAPLVKAACLFSISERYQSHWEVRAIDKDVEFVVDHDASKIYAKPAMPISGSFTAEDYPTVALRNGQTGLSTAKLKISAGGIIEDCVASGATDELNARACEVLKSGRIRFAPAIDASGRVAAIKQPFRVNWALPE